MFWRKKEVSTSPIALAVNPNVAAKPFLVAASRIDSDHTTGSGQVAITGQYDSKKDSFAVDGAYALNPNSTLYASYGVTDERVNSVGVETSMTWGARRATVDMTYAPPRDSAVVKLGMRQGKVKLSAVTSLDSVRTERLNKHGEQFELDATLSGVESLKLSFNAANKAAKLKVSRKLDAKNKLDAEYAHNDVANRVVSLKLKHSYSKVHTFSALVNYGLKKYTMEWDCNTDNGPWTVSTSFPFNASPHSGDWHVKRRFEF